MARVATWTVTALAVVAAACGGGGEETSAEGSGSPPLMWTTLQDTTARVAVVEGLSGPEAVKYDADQDVWFVSNFGAGGDEPGGDGFIARVAADGTMETLHFMKGTASAPLLDPRGMAIRADTLWVADAAGVHAFDRRSGAHAGFVSFTRLDPGFINDLAFGPDGALYATDTGRSRIYRVHGGRPEIAIEDPRLGPPNGILWDADAERFLLAPWGGEKTFRSWRPDSPDILDVVSSADGANFDGIELWQGRVVAASQVDSSLHVLEDGATRAFVRVAGRPADIAVDTRRGRVAVPYIDLNRVDIWDLPRGG